MKVVVKYWNNVWYLFFTLHNYKWHCFSVFRDHFSFCTCSGVVWEIISLQSTFTLKSFWACSLYDDSLFLSSITMYYSLLSTSLPFFLPFITGFFYNQWIIKLFSHLFFESNPPSMNTRLIFVVCFWRVLSTLYVLDSNFTVLVCNFITSRYCMQ